MSEPQQTLTRHFPLSRLPLVIERLTHYVVQQRYGFFQTRHDIERTDFDIYDAQNRLIVRICLRATDVPDMESGVSSPVTSESLPVEIQHLLYQIENPS